jgi:acyl carrier protein
MKNKIKEVLSEVLEMDNSEITDDLNQENCLKWDSLQHLNIMVELEETFDLSFEPEEIADMITLEKIIEIVTSKK